VDDAKHLDFEDMVEYAPCGFVSLTPGGLVEYVNRTLLVWTGHAAEQIIGKRFSEFLSMAGRIYYETHIAPLLRMQGMFEEFAIDVLKADGQPLQMIANAAERRDADGKPLAIRLTLLRATDRRRYEQELLRAREMARTGERSAAINLQREHEASELREQFIAVLGHDLRNPLASISAGARILDRTAQTEKEHQVIAMMQTTVMRMSGLIDDVLDLARGRLGGGIGLSRDHGKPLEPVLMGVVDELRLASPGRVIEADFKIDRPVNCDRSRLGQLLSNLVGNALTHGASSKPVLVHAETRPESFELWVSNAGQPIPEAAMGKLFEPFFRGNAHASRQGLGLGLYIASQIAKAHGGELAVRSTAEETRFTFTMPLLPASDLPHSHS
jgi:phosphoserine phosphatase RsbU/P